MNESVGRNASHPIPADSGGPAIPAHYTDSGVERRIDSAVRHPGADSTGLVYYWRLIARRRRPLLAIAAAGALAGVIATLAQTRWYQAHASIEIQAPNSEFMNIRQIDPNSPAVDSDAYLQTQIKILQSKQLSGRVLEKMKLAGSLAPGTPTSKLTALLGRLGLKSSEKREDAVRRNEAELFGNLVVRRAGQSRVVEISADSTNPRVASEFLNSLASEFAQQNLEARSSSSQNTGEWLTGQLQEMRTKLQESETRLQEYAQRSGLLITGERTSPSDDKLRQLQQDLTAAQSERISRQTRYERARSAPLESLPDMIADATLREDVSKLKDLKRQLAELNAHFTPEHSKVKGVQSEIGILEASLDRQRSVILDRIRSDYEEAQSREKLLRDAYASQAGVVNQDAGKSIQYGMLKREVDSNRQIYESMLQKVKEAGIAGALRPSNIRLIDPAEPPANPYKPNPVQNVSIGLLGGLLLGLGFVVAREHADRTIQQPGEAAHYINLPELAVIPSVKANDRGSPVRRLTPGEGQRALPSPGAPPVEAEFVTFGHGPSPFDESLRSALLSIVYAGNKENPQRVLALTSSNPGDGKTTVVSNLAMVFASLNKRVLLIDGDLRRPRLHLIFGLTNDIGFSDLLEGNVSLDSPDCGVVRESRAKNLFVITSGGSSTETTILNHPGRLRELMDRFREEFDMVLIDTPPILQIPDSRALGRVVDSVVLIARAGKTTRDAIAAARDQLAEDGTPVLGIMLNDWNPNSSANGYYGYYGSAANRYYQQYYGSRTK